MKAQTNTICSPLDHKLDVAKLELNIQTFEQMKTALGPVMEYVDPSTWNQIFATVPVSYEEVGIDGVRIYLR
jgi:hypothetical protein